MDANERKMAHAGINTDPLPVLGAVDIQPSYRLKERCVPHVRITHVDELKQMYDFGNVIGRGGFGTVLTVKEKYTTKEWAMKTVFKSAAGERLKLVKREIQILKLITHPHIIYLDRIFESPKKIYMIFEKCCGELGKIYNEKKPFSEATARKIVMEIAEAVAYLHKFDIVHRDLKMENILIGLNPRDPNDEYYVKVTDFGLSIMKSGSGVDDMLHDYCGTITYMAPEMLSTCSYSQQCDTWAIGVILYMLVMGKYPFFSQDEKQLRYQICNDNLKFDQTIKLAPALEDLLKKTLVKNPAFRMTATEILEHPWIQNKTMNACGTKGNILDIMKEWKQELLGKNLIGLCTKIAIKEQQRQWKQTLGVGEVPKMKFSSVSLIRFDRSCPWLKPNLNSKGGVFQIRGLIHQRVMGWSTEEFAGAVGSAENPLINFPIRGNQVGKLQRPLTVVCNRP